MEDPNLADAIEQEFQQHDEDFDEQDPGLIFCCFFFLLRESFLTFNQKNWML